jgi:hypothetical protein
MRTHTYRGQKLGQWSALAAQCAERLDANVCDLCVMIEYVDIKVNNSSQAIDIKKSLLKSRFNIGF